jgi:hypothetical protein
VPRPTSSEELGDGINVSEIKDLNAFRIFQDVYSNYLDWRIGFILQCNSRQIHLNKGGPFHYSGKATDTNLIGVAVAILRIIWKEVGDQESNKEEKTKHANKPNQKILIKDKH